MILHIGNGKTVREGEIVGIFDLDNATLQKDSRTYLSAATRAHEVTYADSDIPRTFLVTAKKKRKISASIPQGEDTILPSPTEKGAAGASPCPLEKGSRPRHPSRKKREKAALPAQTVLLSHISSGALHARTERPFDEE